MAWGKVLRQLAVIIDGVWQPTEVCQPSVQPPVVDGHHQLNERNDFNSPTPTSEVDQIATLLAQVVRRAQPLSEPDRRRVRDFCHATQAMLTATTYLPEADQKLFAASLRDAAAKNG
jgi:hypothetical protein